MLMALQGSWPRLERGRKVVLLEYHGVSRNYKYCRQTMTVGCRICFSKNGCIQHDMSPSKQVLLPKRQTMHRLEPFPYQRKLFPPLPPSLLRDTRGNRLGSGIVCSRIRLPFSNLKRRHANNYRARNPCSELLCSLATKQERRLPKSYAAFPIASEPSSYVATRPLRIIVVVVAAAAGATITVSHPLRLLNSLANIL